MIGWGLEPVTVNAIVKVGVGKPNSFPSVGIVANGALPGVVILRQYVAILAIRKARMVKPGVFPV